MNFPMYILAHLRACRADEQYSDVLYGGEPMIFEDIECLDSIEAFVKRIIPMHDAGGPFIVLHIGSLSKLNDAFMGLKNAYSAKAESEVLS